MTNPYANPSTATPPRTVNIAFWLFLLVALTRLVAIIIAVATFGAASDAAKSSIAGTGSNVSSSQVDGILRASLIASIVFAVLFLVAFVLFDYFMRRGANWARIVLLILTILSLFNVLGAYGVGAIGFVAGVVATILMFLRPSSEYFQAVKARKVGR